MNSGERAEELQPAQRFCRPTWTQRDRHNTDGMRAAASQNERAFKR